MKRVRKVRGAKPSTLALIVAGAVAVALTFGLFVVDYAGERLIERRQHLVVETARDYFVAFAHQEGLPAMARALDHRARNENGAFAYAVFDNDGARMGGANLLNATDLPEPGYATRRIAGADYEILLQPMAVGGTLVIYENLADRRAFHQAILAAVGAALLFSLVIVAGAALLLGRLLVRRAEGIALAAETIAGGDLSARAPIAGVGDVFDDLADAVNAMLVRIEELMTGMRTVTDSLSHDLRSPLTRLRGALNRAQDQGLAESERLALIGEAQAQCEEVLATFGALLDIARAESGLSRDLMAPLDLAELVRDLGDLFEPVIEDADQSLTIEAPAGPIPLVGHELILRQALGNLLHNAARYAGPGASVTLALRSTDQGGAELIVADSGPGVPAADRGRVLERFVRLDESRATTGSGLGLAIAAACAKLHGGQLRLEDNRPGLRVVLSLPPTS
ncbi:HAMP domain-containing sensor histidine kinase [Caulobacter soli]|uniref:HAMP domain-containing sensor histidine kinase n=1 Tax=Caulobacter soli TaxID=2708539 RepID=UPI0013EA65E5|nr:HAMP domain-containing sensor histidine kinase [Caulobacter soli]